jgi:hypothetical protein
MAQTMSMGQAAGLAAVQSLQKEQAAHQLDVTALRENYTAQALYWNYLLQQRSPEEMNGAKNVTAGTLEAVVHILEKIVF